MISNFRWTLARRSAFVLMLAMPFLVAWNMIVVPEAAGYILITASVGLYLFTCSRATLPTTPFSDNIAHSSHPSNVMMRETFISLAIATPFLVCLAWLSERLGH